MDFADLTSLPAGTQDPQSLPGKLVFLGIVVVVALVVQHVVVRVARRMLDASKVPSASIFVNILRALIWSFALLAVLEPVFGVQPTAFVTALGVTSVAISLGLQDTVSNVIGGLGLMTARVVKPGDQVTIGDISGMVTDVTWRSTMVRSRDGSVEVIPNSVLNKQALTRRTAWSVTDCPVPLVIAHGADLDVVTAEIVAAAKAGLGEWLDPAFEVEVIMGSIAATGVSCTVHLHVTEGIALGRAADTLVRALAGKGWLARVCNASGEVA